MNNAAVVPRPAKPARQTFRSVRLSLRRHACRRRGTGWARASGVSRFAAPASPAAARHPPDPPNATRSPPLSTRDGVSGRAPSSPVPWRPTRRRIDSAKPASRASRGASGARISASASGAPCARTTAPTARRGTTSRTTRRGRAPTDGARTAWPAAAVRQPERRPLRQGRHQRPFLRAPDGRRPVFGDARKFQTDPHWRDHLLFYEYFHGDNGAGIGASHQTGWTGLVAKMFAVFGSTSAAAILAQGAGAAGRASAPAA